MRNTMAILGICFMAAGGLSGAVNWYIAEFLLEAADWEGPLVEVNSLCWLASVVGLGLGGVFIGMAVLAREQPRGSYGEPGAGPPAGNDPRQQWPNQ